MLNLSWSVVILMFQRASPGPMQARSAPGRPGFIQQQPGAITHDAALTNAVPAFNDAETYLWSRKALCIHVQLQGSVGTIS